MAADRHRSRAGCGDDEQRADAVLRPTQPLRRSRVGPLQVVDDEHGPRGLAGELIEHRRELPLAIGHGVRQRHRRSLFPAQPDDRLAECAHGLQQRLQRQVAAEYVGPGDHDVPAAASCPFGEVTHEGGLADTGLTDDEDDAHLPERGFQVLFQGLQLSVASDQPDHGLKDRCRTVAGTGQHREVHRFGVRSGRDPEVVGEACPHAGVGGERRSGPATGHVRLHQRAQRSLVVRITSQRRGRSELGGDDVAAAQRRRRSQSVSSGDQRHGGGAVGVEPLAVVVGQQLPSGQRERRTGCSSCRTEAAGFQRFRRLADEHRDLVDIEPVDPQRPPRLGPGQPIAAHHPTKARHQYGDLVARPRRQIVSPQRLGQRRQRHRSAAGECQHLHQGACLATPQVGP